MMSECRGLLRPFGVHVGTLDLVVLSLERVHDRKGCTIIGNIASPDLRVLKRDSSKICFRFP